MKKLSYVDALRGMAILGVLMVHCGQHGTNSFPTAIANVLGNGARGVQLFYVASAFTLFLSLSNRSNKELHTNRNFFIRRFFRIAPMYYIGIAYYLFQNGTGPGYWLGDAPGISVANIISNIFFVHGVNPYWITSVVPGGWSIAVEMMFYCLIPFLFARIKNLNQAVIFFIATALFKLLLHVFLLKFPFITSARLWEEYLFLYLPSQLPVFACGIILYFLVYTPRAGWQIRTSVLLLVCGLFLANLLVGINFIFPNHLQFAIGFILLGYALSQKHFHLLVNPVSRYIGKISYSMYLVHLAVLYWMSHFNLVDFIPLQSSYSGVINYGIRFLFLLTVTVIIATVFYRLVEVPFQQLGKKLINRLDNNKQPVDGVGSARA